MTKWVARKPLTKTRGREATNAFGLSIESVRLMRIITDALRPFPEARAAVAAALRRVEEQGAKAA